MKEADFLAKLLDGEKVEWKSLGEVADIGTGSSNREDKGENGSYPFYVRSKNILKADSFEFDEVAIVIPGEGGIGDIFHYVEGKYALHQRAYRIHIASDVVSTKFLFHFMSSSFKKYILMKSVGATAISIRKPMIQDYKIPIPCPENSKKSLEIQAEIVRILDNFTTLTAELTAELTARKKQYTYYREQLLTFAEGEVEWKSLGEENFFEIANSGRKPVKASLRTVGKTPYYGANNIQDWVDGYTHDGEYVLIAEDGSASLENYSIQYVTGKFWANNHVHVLRGKSRVNTRFLFHYLRIVSFIPFLTGGDRAKLTKGNMVEIQIPIPCPKNPKKSLEIQAKIVRILDNFDALTNSITEGLPREIQLRTKQYEYYRDLLLNFPKNEVVK